MCGVLFFVDVFRGCVLVRSMSFMARSIRLCHEQSNRRDDKFVDGTTSAESGAKADSDGSAHIQRLGMNE